MVARVHLPGSGQNQVVFRRKPSDAQWVVAAGEYEGKPIITRFDHGHRKAAGKGPNNIRIGVAVELTAPDERGFPTPEEVERLDALERRIEEETDGKAVLVGVITTAGTREWLLHASDAEWIEPFHHGLDAATSEYEVQVIAEHDPGWDVYRAFV